MAGTWCRERCACSLKRDSISARACSFGLAQMNDGAADAGHHDLESTLEITQGVVQLDDDHQRVPQGRMNVGAISRPLLIVEAGHRLRRLGPAVEGIPKGALRIGS